MFGVEFSTICKGQPSFFFFFSEKIMAKINSVYYRPTQYSKDFFPLDIKTKTGIKTLRFFFYDRTSA